MSSLVLPCLWTAQKTQKRKKWNEGEVRFVATSKWAGLHVKKEGSGRVEQDAMDGKYLEIDEYAAIVAGQESTFETEKHLVELMPPEKATAAALQPCGRLAALAALDGPALKKFKKPVAAAPPARRAPFSENGQLAPAPGRPGRVVNYGSVEPPRAPSPDRRPPAPDMYSASRWPTSGSAVGGRDEAAQLQAGGSIASWFSDCPTELPSQEDSPPGQGWQPSQPPQPWQQSDQNGASRRGPSEIPSRDRLGQGGGGQKSHGGYRQGIDAGRWETQAPGGWQRFFDTDCGVQETQNGISKGGNVDDVTHYGNSGSASGGLRGNTFHEESALGRGVEGNQCNSGGASSWFGTPEEPVYGYSGVHTNVAVIVESAGSNTHKNSISDLSRTPPFQPTQPPTNYQPTSNGAHIQPQEVRETKKEWLCECGVWSPGEADQCDICGAPAPCALSAPVPEPYFAPMSEQPPFGKQHFDAAALQMPNKVEPVHHAAQSLWQQNEDSDEDGLLDDLLDDGAQVQKVPSSISAVLKHPCPHLAPTKPPTFSLTAGEGSSESDSDNET